MVSVGKLRMAMKSVDSAMGAPAPPYDEHEKLVGRHVRPCVGQFVVMSKQGLLRRKDAGRKDPSRGGIGRIVRVNANWTCGTVLTEQHSIDFEDT